LIEFPSVDGQSRFSALTLDRLAIYTPASTGFPFTSA
jgi:hypothetical protein